MVNKDIYAIAFFFTVVAACVLWALAALIYRNDRRDFLHTVFALGLVFMGIWFLSGFPERLSAAPSSTFAMWTFRWAYASAFMTSNFLLLFSISLYLGKVPSRKVRGSIFVVMTGGVAASLTPLVIQSATFDGNTLKTVHGPLFVVMAVALLGEICANIILMISRWSRSYGIERSRMGSILYGTGLFFPIVLISIFLVPAVLGNDASASFAFVGGIIPVACVTYSVVRLRILDTRVIVRRTGVLATFAVAFAIPVLLLFVFFSVVKISLWSQYVIMFLVLVTLLVMAPDAWVRLRRISSRLFFSELYDEQELMNEITTRLIGSSSLFEGMEAAQSIIVDSLGLDGLQIVVTPGVLSQDCWRFGLTRTGDIDKDWNFEDDYSFPQWLSDVDCMVVSRELKRRPIDADEAALGSEMVSSGVAACSPIVVGSQLLGYLVVNNKVSDRKLSATDLDLLEEGSSLFGLYIHNFSLSARLTTKFQELEKARDFSSELVKFTSHEFRTPVTIISGFAELLASEWESMGQEERAECIAAISNASKRLTNLTGKFLSAERLSSGKVSNLRVPIQFSEMVESLVDNLPEDERSRLVIEGDTKVVIHSDPTNLKLILLNLIENALRFSPADRPVVLRAWMSGPSACIQVKDFGEGIPLEEKQKVFEPFVRLESPSNVGGVGLGLHIVRLLTAGLGIEVEISSGREGGTAMTLSFEPG